MSGASGKQVKKVVLAYSGGLDTSVILNWLQVTYGCEVVTFTADLGQGEELAPAREKALAMGVKAENIFIDTATTFLPPILAGLACAGILAAAISSSDSYLLISASAISQNIYRGLLKKDATEKQVMRISRITLSGWPTGSARSQSR